MISVMHKLYNGQNALITRIQFTLPRKASLNVSSKFSHNLIVSSLAYGHLLHKFRVRAERVGSGAKL
jgi:hypothetical protein